MIEINYTTIIIQMAFFLMVWVVLSRLLFSPLLKLFKERQRRTTDTLKETQDMEEKAERLHSEYKFAIENAKREASIEKETLRKEALGREMKILAEAHQDAQKIITELKAKIEKEALAARVELKEKAAFLSLEVAERIMGRSLG
mgnify:CR=1 FL=1